MSKTRNKLREKALKENTQQDISSISRVLEKGTAPQVSISQELKDFITPIGEEEQQLLERSIREEGVREALHVWRKDETTLLLVDGHNRYEIIRKIEQETGERIDYRLNYLELPDFEAVKDWMLVTQLGRRNLTAEQRSYLRGLRYEREKKKISNAEGRNQYRKEVVRQNDEQPTHHKLAKEYNVSPKTIERDAEFAKGIEVIAQGNQALKRDILMGKVKVRKADVQLLGKGPLPQQPPNIKGTADLQQLLQSQKATAGKKPLATEAASAFPAIKKDLQQKVQLLGKNSTAQDYAAVRELLKKLEKLSAKHAKTHKK